jgi:hypothetical protein
MLAQLANSICLGNSTMIGLIACELLTMKAASAAEYANTVRCAHLIFLIVCGGMLGFVHSHFGIGLRSLLMLAHIINAAWPMRHSGTPVVNRDARAAQLNSILSFSSDAISSSA